MFFSYTGHHLYGILLPMQPLCLISGKNLCQFHNNQLTIYKIPLVTLWQRFTVDHHFFPVPFSFSFLAVLISPIAQKAVCGICVNHIQFRAVHLCKSTPQSKMEILLINIQSAIIEIVIRLSGHGFLQKQMSRIIWVSQSAISKALLLVFEMNSLAQGLR